MAGMDYRRSIPDELLRSFDPVAHAITTIDGIHRLTHDGMVFIATGKSTILTSATKEFIVSVPAGVIPYFNNASMTFGGGDIDLTYYEGTTTSDDGTPAPTQNTNRNSANTAGVVFYANPTVTDDGELLQSIWAHPTSTGTGNKTGVADVRTGAAWVLKPDTKYLIRITNNDGDMSFSYQFHWYEISYTT